jgi:excinuclease ABC subunit C
MDIIKEKLSTLPDKPGVYLHKDKTGEIIYVGKASSLKNRVRQYFQTSRNMDPKVRAMVSHIDDFEYIVTGNEVEALILENNLIKKYMPRYNVLLRDDKTFPYIKITMSEKFPRILKTRIIKNDGSKYYGPYADVKSVNMMMDLLSDIFKLKRCPNDDFPQGFRPCLNGHINKCRMICQGKISREEYMEGINAISAFLKGRDSAVIKYLKSTMDEASEALDFEKAARYRDYIASANSVIRKQRVELLSSGDMDIVLASDVVMEPKDSNITVFFVRNGRLSGREVHKLRKPENTSNSEITAAFIKQYYTSQSMIPKELILEERIPDEDAVEELLSNMKEQKVSIIVPQRGKKKDLLKLAQKDIGESIRVQEVRKEKSEALSQEIGSELSRILDLDVSNDNLRMEAYDISHTGGVDSVGAMVVFNGQKPFKKGYRRFKIRSEDGSDDYGNMQEVLYRRLKRGLDGDSGFLPMPAIILIDGGLGHVSAVNNVLNGLSVDIPVVGMVKDDKHRTRGLIVDGNEISLKDVPQLAKLLGRIQEEVHRYVIDYHRGLRGKNSLKSELDNIEGIGPKRRVNLFNKFGNIERIKAASVEELTDTLGMNTKAAQRIKDYFK